MKIGFLSFIRCRKNSMKLVFDVRVIEFGSVALSCLNWLSHKSRLTVKTNAQSIGRRFPLFFCLWLFFSPYIFSVLFFISDCVFIVWNAKQWIKHSKHVFNESNQVVSLCTLRYVIICHCVWNSHMLQLMLLFCTVLSVPNGNDNDRNVNINIENILRSYFSYERRLTSRRHLIDWLHLIYVNRETEKNIFSWTRTFLLLIIFPFLFSIETCQWQQY